ncbi:SH3 domain-containing protein [Luteococcus peritonei]|uniref:SH3 domain-containing protein n=1 Tax=Luteococcus peritonei TaxID=88874 RepID=A0ABW4RSM4_9ACTN
MPVPTHANDDQPRLEAVASTDDLENAGPESLEAAPASGRRRLVAPLAIVTGLALAVGGAMLLPEQVDAQVGEPQAPTSAASQALPSRSSEAVSRSQQRPALGDAGARLAAQAVGVKPVVASSAPAATAAPKPARKATAAPKPTRVKAAATQRQAVPALGEVTATLYTTTGVNVRTAPSTSADKATSLAPGESVKATSVRRDGWRQIKLDGRAGWIRSAYLTSERPVVRKASSESTPDSERSTSRSTSSTRSTVKSSARTSQKRTVASSGSATGGGSCSSYAVERGLVSNAVAVHRAVCASFPSIKSFGGLRASADNHGTGHALDVMVSGSQGQAVANWARANASRLGITEVIYAQQIWTTQRAGEGWRSMSDRGSATANHYDHVHISVR